MGFSQTAKAQTAATYTFSTSSGTYSAITGGTLFSSGASMDDASFSYTIPSFTYLGVAYTQIYVSENGYIQFGSTATTTTMRSYLSSTETAAKSGVSGFSRDLGGKATSSSLRAETIGSEVIFQWTNMANYASTAQTVTFQIRLNTSTNVISVVYDMSATTSTTAQVGLRGSTTDFNNRTSTSSWAASAAGAVNTATMTLSGTAFPTTGLNYIWSPPLPCSSKPAGGTIASSVGAAPLCPSSAAILSISGSTSATGIVYAWDSSTVSSTGPWFTIPGAIATTYSAMPNPCTNAYYRRRTICTSVGLFDSSNSVLVSVKCALNPPYFENFESITVANTMPNCMTATNLGSLVTSYLAAAGTYNRFNNTPGGSKFASFRYSANDYMFTPAINIIAGKTYEFSFWYITDGLGGWDSLKVQFGPNASPAGMTTNLGPTLSGLTNTNYKKHKIRFVATTSGIQYFGIYCKASGVPWYLSIDDIGLQEAPLCSGVPTPGIASASPNRVCGTGTTELDLPTLPLAVGYTYKWQDSTIGSTWGDDISRPSFGGSTLPFTTGLIDKKTYFRCIVKCNLTGDSSISGITTVDAGPIEPPYFETFESISGNNQLPVCMTATNLGSLVLSYTAPQTTYNRTNHTPGGSKYASFRWACDDYIFTPQMKLIAGQKYIFSFWYITDGLAGWNTISAKYGADPLPASMSSSLKTISAPRNTTYAQYIDTFTAPATGNFNFGIYCNSTSAPWYLSIDDIGLQFKPCDGVPSAATISSKVPSGAGICPNTFVSLNGIGGTFPGIPGIKYQWQRTAIGSGSVVWQNIVGANDTLLSADTLGGFDYRLTTVCTNTNDSAFSSIYSLPLLAAHKPISITPSATPASFCLGDTVYFSATNVVGSVYDWMLDSVVIPGWKFNDLGATKSGKYSVRVSSPSAPCPAYSNTVTLFRNDPGYDVSLSLPTDSIFCDGTSVLLSGFGSKSGLSFQWSKDNVLIPGATSNNYLVSVTGNYKVKVYDGLSVCPAVSRNIKMTVNPTPAAILTVVGGSTTACENDGIVLKSNTGLFSYEWTKSSSTIFGWTDSMQLVKNSGVYRVKVRSKDGCTSVSLPVNINILPSPTPTVTKTGLLLSTPGFYTSYFWVRNSTDTLSKTATINVSKKGTYRLHVIDANGCVGISGPIEMNESGLGIEINNTTELVRIYPNPTINKIFIESTEMLFVEIKDITGKTIIVNQQTKEVDLSQFADGIYILQLRDKDQQFIKQHKISKVSQR